MSRKDPAGEDPIGYGADTATVVGLPPADLALILIGIPVLGAVVGFLLPPIADWAAALPWAPFQGPLELIASFESVWVVAVCVAVGLLAGVGLAVVAVIEGLKVTLTDERIQLDKDGQTRVIARSEVDAAFMDGKKLVILDGESHQLVRETHESTADRIAWAFRAHGYPWVDQDPYAELYRRWVPDAPELPPTVNAVLRAREAALRNKAAEDVTELREEVQKLGFVVRDEETRQYWRPLVRS